MVMLTFESVDKIPKSMIVVLDLTKLYLLIFAYIQLFQLTLSDFKATSLRDKTEN